MKPTSEGKRHGPNRDRRYDGHKTEEDSVAFRKRSAQFNVESLAACSHELDGTKAVGIDGFAVLT